MKNLIHPCNALYLFVILLLLLLHILFVILLVSSFYPVCERVNKRTQQKEDEQKKWRASSCPIPIVLFSAHAL